MDFWMPKGNLGMGEEGHSQHGDVCTGGEDRAPPPTFGCSRSPESSQGGLQPPTPSLWGSFPRCSSAGLIHNFQHPGGQLFATSLGRSRLGRREMSQRAIKD